MVKQEHMWDEIRTAPNGEKIRRVERTKPTPSGDVCEGCYFDTQEDCVAPRGGTFSCFDSERRYFWQKIEGQH